ncbi:MAG TPA: CoA ester lyase [Homoserinimonas sp.]|nr:CoA ester lyase [Homoserinimonas sp.]
MADFSMGPAILFCPADRPDRYQKAVERADAVILDLEDAVSPDAKDFAREAVAVSTLDPERTIVRVNSVDTDAFAADLIALARTAYRTVMLAKAEHPSQLAALAGFDVVALIETAAGVLNAPAIAAEPNVVGLMWGAEDLVASLGGTSSRSADGRYRSVAQHARSTVLLAAGGNGKAAIDAIYTNIPDLEGLAAEAADAVASGFTATACIHPSQVDVIRSEYLPSEADVVWARSVLDAADGEHGVFQLGGRMIDGPILKHARKLLRRAGR